MFKSPKNFVKGALTIAAGAALCVATGGAAAPFLVAAGAIGGGFQVVKGAINASKATTDAEAKAAWEGIGAGSGAIALSVAGAKKAAVAGGIEGAENMSALHATAACIKNSPASFSRSVSMFISGEALANLRAFGTTKPVAENTDNSPKDKPLELEMKDKPKTEALEMKDSATGKAAEPKTAAETSAKTATKTAGIDSEGQKAISNAKQALQEFKNIKRTCNDPKVVTKAYRRAARAMHTDLFQKQYGEDSQVVIMLQHLMAELNVTYKPY